MSTAIEIGNIEVATEMTFADCVAIYRRHGLEMTSGAAGIATVLGGLEAEIAAITAERDAITARAHEAGNEWAELLLAERAEVARLKATIRKVAEAIGGVQL